MDIASLTQSAKREKMIDMRVRPRNGKLTRNERAEKVKARAGTAWMV